MPRKPPPAVVAPLHHGVGLVAGEGKLVQELDPQPPRRSARRRYRSGCAATRRSGARLSPCQRSSVRRPRRTVRDGSTCTSAPCPPLRRLEHRRERVELHDVEHASRLPELHERHAVSQLGLGRVVDTARYFTKLLSVVRPVAGLRPLSLARHSLHLLSP